MNQSYYDIHPVANIVAMAGSREQEALTNDIKINGQKEPAVLWRNKIVDGRCRQLSCISLGVPLKVRSLDKKLSEEEVSKIVKSLNTRRNLTDTQKLASAYMEQQRRGNSNKDIAKEWAVSVRSLQNFKYIAANKPELVKPLFNGDSVSLLDPEKGFKITTNRVNMLARIIKQEQEKNNIVVVTPEQIDAMTYNINGYIATEAGKSAHKKLVSAFKTSGNKEEMFSAIAAELMNYKFKEIK